MYEFHAAIIRPLLHATAARRVLEVGADQGHHTALLQGYCDEAGAVLDVIDAGPCSPSLLALADHARTQLHVGTSHEWIPKLPLADVALIDGDHNYFTVRGELDALADRAAEVGMPLPTLVLHDVGWPYGRRDMYYEPSRIPATALHPHAKAAIALDRADLLPPDTPGFNAGFHNAIQEGGPHNGVLTAVEDFIADRVSCRLVVIPGLHSVAVAASDARLAAKPALADFFDVLEASPPLREALAVVERLRLEALAALMREAWDAAHAQAQLSCGAAPAASAPPQRPASA